MEQCDETKLTTHRGDWPENRLVYSRLPRKRFSGGGKAAWPSLLYSSTSFFASSPSKSVYSTLSNTVPSVGRQKLATRRNQTTLDTTVTANCKEVAVSSWQPRNRYQQFELSTVARLPRRRDAPRFATLTFLQPKFDVSAWTHDDPPAKPRLAKREDRWQHALGTVPPTPQHRPTFHLVHRGFGNVFSFLLFALSATTFVLLVAGHNHDCLALETFKRSHFASLRWRIHICLGVGTRTDTKLSGWCMCIRHAQATHVKSAWVQVYSRRHSVLQRQLRDFNRQSRDVRRCRPNRRTYLAILTRGSVGRMLLPYLSCTSVSIQTAYTQYCIVIQSLHQWRHGNMHTNVTLLTCIWYIYIYIIPWPHFSRKYSTFVFSVRAEINVVIWNL